MTASKGQSMAQLCRQKRHHCAVNNNIAMSSIPMEVNNDTDNTTKSNIVTPLNKNNDIRWYRNSIFDNDVIIENEKITGVSNLKYVISDVTKKSTIVDALRKKVMKCLLDVTSPTCW